MVEYPESGGFTVRDLVDIGLNHKQSDFEFIRTYADMLNLKNYMKVMLRAAYFMRGLYKKTSKEYQKQIKSGRTDVELVIAVNQTKVCLDFFKTEVLIVEDMLDEYLAYLVFGHLLSAIKGEVRSNKDLEDFRYKKF